MKIDHNNILNILLALKLLPVEELPITATPAATEQPVSITFPSSVSWDYVVPSTEPSDDEIQIVPGLTTEEPTTEPTLPEPVFVPTTILVQADIVSTTPTIISSLEITEPTVDEREISLVSSLATIPLENPNTIKPVTKAKPKPKPAPIASRRTLSNSYRMS